jgi:hypothetical protein
MSNSGRESLDQQLQSDSAMPTEAQACTTLFCTTLANLNAISEQYMKGLLNIAITAAEAAESLSSSEQEAGAEKMANTQEDVLSELAGQLKDAANKISQRGITPATVESESEAATQIFCDKVEVNIIGAMQNSLANQQELNTLGQAILAQAAILVFSSARADFKKKS